MQTHITTTPFGRRSMSLGQIASQVTAREMPANAEADKWQVFKHLSEAKDLIGATDRALAVLSALLSFHPARKTLSADDNLIVWPSNEQLRARANGMSLATLQRHLANLVLCGLVIRRDSPNGKRFARKGQGGSIAQAYGFDLSPIVARAKEFNELAQAVAAEKKAHRLVRERVSLCRRDVVKLIESGRDEGVPGDWSSFEARYRAIVDDFPRTAPRQYLERIASELEGLRKEIANLLESFIKEQNMRSNESHFEARIQNSNPESHFESEEGRRKEKETRGNAEEADNVRALPRRDLPLGMVLNACPEIENHAGGSPMRTWRDLLAAAESARPYMGVSPSAWQEAIEVMGAKDAAITLAAILQRSDEINSCGGYLRSLTDRARGARFSTWPMVMALLNAKMSRTKSAAAGEEPDFEQGVEGRTGERSKSGSIEISSALAKSLRGRGWK